MSRACLPQVFSRLGRLSLNFSEKELPVLKGCRKPEEVAFPPLAASSWFGLGESSVPNSGATALLESQWSQAAPGQSVFELPSGKPLTTRSVHQGEETSGSIASRHHCAQKEWVLLTCMWVSLSL